LNWISSKSSVVLWFGLKPASATILLIFYSGFYKFLPFCVRLGQWKWGISLPSPARVYFRHPREIFHYFVIFSLFLYWSSWIFVTIFQKIILPRNSIRSPRTPPPEPWQINIRRTWSMFHLDQSYCLKRSQACIANRIAKHMRFDIW
jgi:hypothetical protein